MVDLALFPFVVFAFVFLHSQNLVLCIIYYFFGPFGLMKLQPGDAALGGKKNLEF